MKQLALTLLGGISLSADGGPIALAERKAAALLAYLALRPDERHAREKLATLLWGRQTDEQARRNLRHCLGSLRKSLGVSAAAVIVADQTSIMLRAAAIEVDVGSLRQLANGERTAALAEAVGLCGGELLADLNLREEGFEDWLGLERETARKLQADVLRRFAEGRLDQGDAEPAVAAAENLAKLDPLDEPAQRLLMRSYAAAGRRSAALAHYQACKELLEKELSVEPEAETKALLDAIRAQGGGEKQVDGDAPVALAPTPEEGGSGPEAHPSIPGKPSIAVLPFDNMSEDPDQEFFADGIVEDVITALSRFRSLFVIARNSTFTYKGRAVDVTEIARDLGVRYVVEGSVRKAGERVRITAQLIDALSGKHIWAERFDGTLDDIFELQDQITQQIVVVIAPEIEAHERERVRRKPPESLDAWELVQRGLSHLYRHDKTSFDEAIRLFREAVALDPGFAAAHANLAYTIWNSVIMGYAEDTATAVATARAAAERAVTLDPNDPVAHTALGRLHTTAGEPDLAIGEMQTAIALNPNFAWGHYGLGFAYHAGVGQAEQALPHYDTALRLSPRDPLRWTMLMMKGSALRFLGRHDEAIAHCRQACQFPETGHLPFMHLAAALEEAGQKHEARVALEKAMQLQPALSMRFLHSRFAGEHESILKSLHDSLSKVGLPERLYGIAPAAQAPTAKEGVGGAEEHPTIPGKPSIAVLPFDNMSEDPDQEFFADGIVEDVITALSRFRSLFVIARNSTFTFNSPLKKALLTGFHSTAKHNATKAVSPSSETMRTI